MREAGAALQAAIFKKLEDEAGLADKFSMTGMADISPQFSYDGMASLWRDKAVHLARHEIGFSVWGAQAGFADAQDLGEKLVQTMLALDLLPPHRLIEMSLQDVSSGFDNSSRLWRQRLGFLALTGRTELR